MKTRELSPNAVACALFLALLQLAAISAEAKKPRVTFTSPCECIGNHGVSRWAAKTDTQELPTNAGEIKKATPGQILAWQGPGGKIDQRTDRVAAENQWYAVTGRVDKIKVEPDGDVHIDLKEVGSDAAIVVELPLGPRWCEMRTTVFSWTDAKFPLTGKFKVTKNPIITVVGKAFYDIDHSGKDTNTNRRNYDQSLAVWEIHPVMKIAVESADSPSVATAPKTPEKSAPATKTVSPPAITPVPQATATSEQFVTLTRPVTIQIPHGSTVLQPGMKLPVLSRDSQNVDVRYMDARYSIPISSTDSQ